MEVLGWKHEYIKMMRGCLIGLKCIVKNVIVSYIIMGLKKLKDGEIVEEK